jgi:DNA (cytosine-5)-methyltransferase 1
MNELALFAGAGGGILGGKLLGWRTVCAVEWDAYAASVLISRQNDGVLPPFPIWDDVCSFDGRPWQGRIDVVSGGFPCQDISSAGKGAGIEGKRSGMWFQMARIIREVGPRYVFVENSPLLTRRGLNRVLGDLAAMGYDARWGVLGAADIGANHQRNRIWIVGNASSIRWSKGWNDHGQDDGSKAATDGQHASQMAYAASLRQQAQSDICEYSKKDGNGQANQFGSEGEMDNTDSTYGERNKCAKRIFKKYANINSASWWATEPNVGRVANGVAARVHRLKAIGNGQVPAVAALAWRILTQ